MANVFGCIRQGLKLIQLIYCSKAVDNFSHIELPGILETARQFNARKDITGLLVYDCGYFMQILEGHKKDVEHLASRIARNSRHTAMQIISTEPISKREFPHWNMAFACVSGRQTSPLGYVDYDPEMVDFSADSSRAVRMLYLFQEGILRPCDKMINDPTQFSVSISSHAERASRSLSVPCRTNYLIELARAIAMSMPDVHVTAEVGRETPVHFNLKGKMEDGQIELF